MNYPKYSAKTVVSPMQDGGEYKDQDRARWHGSCQVACVSDGVTTSPCSDVAAEHVTTFIPSVFSGNPDVRLEMLADVLMKNRQEKCSQEPVIKDGKYSPNMRKMMIDVIRQQNQISHQATVVAAKFSHNNNGVVTDIIKCGDSGFFAFSPDGSLLSSSLQYGSQPDVNHTKKTFAFGPGDEILVRIEGKLPEFEHLVAESGIKHKFADRWLVCTPIDSCREDGCPEDQHLRDVKIMHLTHDDRLLVPEYFYGRVLTSRGKQYRVLRFSSAIQVLTPSIADMSTAGFRDRGSATNVFPDHFYSGKFDFFRDSFPHGTHFVLCSDGFYSAFNDFHELYDWLKANEASLNKADEHENVMSQLHSKLAMKSGDDDISFIWAIPENGENEND